MSGSVNRREFLFLSGAGLLLATIYGGARALQLIDALSARPYPTTDEGGEIKDDRGNFISEAEYQKLYEMYVRPEVDGVTKEPLMPYQTYRNIMPNVQNIFVVLRNQAEAQNRESYFTVFDRCMKMLKEQCSKMNVPFVSFLMTYMIAGRNIGGRLTQQKDVEQSRIQEALDLLQSGTPPERALADYLVSISQNPYHYLFTEEGQKMMEGLLRSVGVKVDLSKLTPNAYYEALRSFIPSIGTWDLETAVYAEAINNLRTQHWFEFNDMAQMFPTEVNALKTLSTLKTELEDARTALKSVCTKILEKHPNLLSEFFVPYSEAELHRSPFHTIEVGSISPSFRRGEIQAILDDRKTFATAQSDAKLSDPTGTFEKYVQRRANIVELATVNHYSALATQDPTKASADLIADEIHNPKFRQWIFNKLVALDQPDSTSVSSLNVAYMEFKNAQQRFIAGRASSYSVISRREGDLEFQMRLAAATGAYYHDQAIQYFPEIAVKQLSQSVIQWKAYIMGLLSECHSLVATANAYLDPRSDSQYQNAIFMSLSRDYIETFIKIGLLEPGDFPNGFQKFAQSEWRFLHAFGEFKTHGDSLVNSYGLSELQFQSIRAAVNRNFSWVFCSWYGVREDIGAKFGQTPPKEYSAKK